MARKKRRRRFDQAAYAQLWGRAKNRCKLDREDVELAQKLGLTPGYLMGPLRRSAGQQGASVKELLWLMHEAEEAELRFYETGGSGDDLSWFPFGMPFDDD